MPSMPTVSDAGRTTPALAEELLATMASIRRSARVLARRPAELAALTGSQLELLRFVRRNPGVSVANAALMLRLAPNTVSTLVGELSSKGLLVRGVDERDRRVARLRLTAETLETVEAFRDRRVAMLAAAIGEMPTHARDELASAAVALRGLARALAEEEGAGA